MAMNKKGFSLIELLIVLVVIASLIAIVTPIALNSIRKAKSTSVANDLKTLSKGFMNYVYTVDEFPEDLNEFARNVDSDKYGITYDDNGNYVVYTNKEVNFNEVATLIDVTSSNSLSEESGKVGLSEIPEDGIFYYASLGLNPSSSGNTGSSVENIPVTLRTTVNNILSEISSTIVNGYKYSSYKTSTDEIKKSWNNSLEAYLQSGEYIKDGSKDGTNIFGLTNPNNPNEGYNGGVIFAGPNLSYLINFGNNIWGSRGQQGSTFLPAYALITGESNILEKLNGNNVNPDWVDGSYIFNSYDGGDSIKVYLAEKNNDGEIELKEVDNFTIPGFQL